MTALFAHVHALAEEIGPRGTGTAGEAAAAAYVKDRLAALGLTPGESTFAAVPSQNVFPLAIDAAALLALIVYPLGGALSRWTAAVLALSTAPMLWQTIRTSNCLLRPLLPKIMSRNVVARVEPRCERCRDVVLLAHLDTNRCRLAWQSGMVRNLRPLTHLTLGMLAIPGLLYLLGAVLGGAMWAWWISLLPASYVLGTVITLLIDDRSPFSRGAHDNAASVAIALGLAAHLVDRPLERTRVWLAFTGAEETDHAGLYSLLRDYRTALQDALFIGLEGLGSGRLVYLTRQGLCARYRPDPALLEIAGRVAAAEPGLGACAAEMTGEDEVGTLRRQGYTAICLAGQDPDTGALPYWHRKDDTVDKISPAFLERARAFVLAVLLDIDRPGAGTAQAD